MAEKQEILLEGNRFPVIAPADHSVQDVVIHYGEGKSLVIPRGFAHGAFTTHALDAIQRKQDAHGREKVFVTKGQFSRIDLDEVR